MGNSKRFLCKMLFLINLWDFAETKWGRRACCLESGTWCYHKTRVAKLAGYEMRLGQALPAALLRHLRPFRFPFKQRGLRQPVTKPLSYLTPISYWHFGCRAGAFWWWGQDSWLLLTPTHQALPSTCRASSVSPVGEASWRCCCL